MRPILLFLLLCVPAFADKPTVHVYGPEDELQRVWRDVSQIPDLQYGVDWDPHVSRDTKIVWYDGRGHRWSYQRWPGDAQHFLRELERTTGEDVQCPPTPFGGFGGNFGGGNGGDNGGGQWQPPGGATPPPPLQPQPQPPAGPDLDERFDDAERALDEKLGRLEKSIDDRFSRFEDMAERFLELAVQPPEPPPAADPPPAPEPAEREPDDDSLAETTERFGDRVLKRHEDLQSTVGVIRAVFEAIQRSEGAGEDGPEPSPEPENDEGTTLPWWLALLLTALGAGGAGYGASKSGSAKPKD